MKMEAEIVVMLPQVKEHQEHQKLEEAREDPPLEIWREHGPADTLILDFWPPLWNNEFLLNHQVCGKVLQES